MTNFYKSSGDVLFDLAGTMSETEEESEYEYSDYEDGDLDADLVKINSSPYSSLPLPDFNEDEVRTASELCEWLKLVSDYKNNFIKNNHQDNKSDIVNSEDIDHNGDLIEEYSEDCTDISTFYGETDDFGRFHGEAEIRFKNGDKICGHFQHGFKHGIKEHP